MNLTVNTFQRCFAAKDNMVKTAGEYQRSTKAIVIQAVVGLLTGGIGSIAIEVYHAANRASKRSDFDKFAGNFLKAAEKKGTYDTSITVEFNGASITIAEDNNGVTISYDEKKATIKSVTIEDLRDKLEQDIVLESYQYHQDTIKKAINYAGCEGAKEWMAKKLLKNIWKDEYVPRDVFSYLAEDDIAELALDVFNNRDGIKTELKNFKSEYDSFNKADKSNEIRYTDGKLSIKPVDSDQTYNGI